MHSICCLVATCISFATDPMPNPAGIWEGALSVSSIKLRLAFKIEQKPDGTYTGTMDSPDQGATGLKLESVTADQGELKIAFGKGAGSAAFAGKFADDGKSAKGTWKQSGQSFPLELTRVEKLTEVRRPQVPKKPYPYSEEEVTVDHPSAQIKLAGTFTKPKDGGPFPTVVLITGSGPQDRDESLLGHKPFLILADHLTRQGIAVLRCDDRGVGKSTGKHSTATSADFATDAYACVQYLKSRPDVDAKRIGLVGHSEGGLIAPMVAADHPKDIAFIVLLAGPGLPGEAVLAEQARAILKADGKSEREIEVSVKLQQMALQIVSAGGTAEEIKKKIEEAAEKFIAELPAEDRKEVERDKELEKKQLDRMVTPWMQYFLKFDPRPTLAKVKCPVLAINGEFDLQVLHATNLAAVEKALRDGGNRTVTIRMMTGLNHLFQHSKTGSPSEYGTIEETFAPEALNAVSDWIIKQK